MERLVNGREGFVASFFVEVEESERLNVDFSARWAGI